jgi:DNA-binding MarR family transcriptional regulator
MKGAKMSERAIAELILHLGRLAQGDGFAAGLTPAQWNALRYFARANCFSRTPSAFAEFHGTTRGTASQTTKSLVAQGYLARTRSEADGRSARHDLTNKARAILAEDPLRALVHAAGAVPSGARGHLANALERMLGHVARECGKRPFGSCTSCKYLEGDGCCREGEPPYHCVLLGEPLTEAALQQLCINFVPGRNSVMKRTFAEEAPK